MGRLLLGGWVSGCVCVAKSSGGRRRGEVLYCGVLCCVVLYCVVLCCVVLDCAALRCTALHCAALRCTALHCAALRCTAMHCDALRCTAIITGRGEVANADSAIARATSRNLIREVRVSP